MLLGLVIKMDSMNLSELVDHAIARDGAVAHSSAVIQYVMHGGGVMLKAKNDHFDITLPLATAEIRGLPVVKPSVKMTAIPAQFLSAIIDHAKARDYEVVYYVVKRPFSSKLELIVGQSGGVASIENIVDPVPDSQIVAQIHSHHHMEAFFSATDDANEQEFRLFGVVGRTQYARPHTCFRLGVHGYHFDIRAHDIFDDYGSVGSIDHFGSHMYKIKVE